MDAPLALYRRYRPETFAEVIGQDHVTEPLRHALASGRAHHAYLFSGPRGCGKTTSARILARAMNCAQAPVAEPCGRCESCRDLARGGPGSIDVIEIDAASHGGVDDARDLREKAFFSPVASRYKIYVIDEAHMVTTQGFNALLKLVEEPPPHLKFVFATTEPDKVIGTIRSRTHHYPFRLVPPRVLSEYLDDLCRREDVRIEATALPLVVRAGGGSVRDTLSILDQLIGGSGPDGVTYELAASLLGYTPDSLLDDVVDAMSAGDGASVFGAVDKVIESGQEPRRFAEDLLQRLRDLIVVSHVPGAADKGLIDLPADAAARLESQASLLGAAELTRAAEVVSRGLDDIRGATAPRLLLELICARVLLPGADHGTDGVLARLDRLERRLTIAGGAPSASATAAVEERVHETEPPLTEPPSGSIPQPPATTTAAQPPPQSQRREKQPVPQPEPGPSAGSAVAHREAEPGGLSLVDVRRLWPDVLDAVMRMRRFAWVMLSQNASVHSLEGQTLTIGLPNAGARDAFMRQGCEEIVRQAMIDKLGVDWRVETIVDPSVSASGAAPAASPPPGAGPARAGREPGPQPVVAPREAPPDSATVEVPPSAAPEPRSTTAAREAIRPIRSGPSTDLAEDARRSDEAVHRDDQSLDEGGVSGEQLVARELGGKLIEEIPHER